MPTLRLDADAKKAAKAFDDLSKSVDKLDDKLELSTREAKKLEAQAKRIVDSNLAPQEKYNKKIEELAKHVKAGTLSMEQAQAQAMKYGQRLDDAGKKGENAFGRNALSGLASFASGWLSVGTAITAVIGTMQKVSVENKRVSDSFFQGLGSVGQLQQVSTTPQEFQQNLGFARSLVQRGIFSDIGQASDFTFATTSAGFSANEKEFLAGVGARKQVAPQGLTGFAQNLRKVQNLFGQGLALSEAADKLTITSGGTQADLSQTAAAVAQFSAASTALGFSGDTSLAALVLNEREAKNIDVGATQVAALLDAIDKEGLNKGSLRASVEGIQARVNAGENVFGVLKNKRAVKGFRAISGDMAGFDQLASQIGGAKGALESRQFLNTDPIAAANALKESTKGAMDSLIESRTAERTALTEAVYNDIIANSNNDLQRALLTFSVGTQANFANMSGRQDAFLRQQLKTDDIGGAGGYLSPDVRSSVESYLRRIAEATEANANGPTTRQE